MGLLRLISLIVICLFYWFYLIGTLPVIFSGYSKSQGQTYFWCKATGIPKPTVSIVKVIGGINKLIQSDTVSVNQDYGNRMYYCIAKNTFGPSKSRNYTIKGNLDIIFNLLHTSFFSYFFLLLESIEFLLGIPVAVDYYHR